MSDYREGLTPVQDTDGQRRAAYDPQPAQEHASTAEPLSAPRADTPQPHAEGDVPTSTVDAQAQAFVEHAEDEAAIAEKNAADAKARADKMNEIANPEPPPEQGAAREDGAGDLQRAFASLGMGFGVGNPKDVVVHSGARNVDMTTTEDDRLMRHKEMVKAHLRNATPDMTGGKGESELDPQTGLERGHVPEGYHDAPGAGRQTDERREAGRT